MKKLFVVVVVVALWPVFAVGQDKAKGGLESPEKTMANPVSAQVAVCTFADGKQLSVRYNPLLVDRGKGFSVGKQWPSDNSMFLFTPVALSVGNSTIPVGAFSLYVIPGHNDWTLIVNKHVTENASYDETQDLVRVAMNIGQVEQPEKDFTVYFAHLAPKQCNMRLYYGTTGSWTEFREQ